MNDAEKERLESELEHESVTTTFDAAQVEVKQLYKDLKKYILKSKYDFRIFAKTKRCKLCCNRMGNLRTIIHSWQSDL